MNLHYESLHNHTTASDGTQTYLEVLKTAEANEFGVIAFTDHDMLPSANDLSALRTYKGPVKWLIGCEISSGLPRELGGGATSMLHILGLFTDPTNEALLDHCAKAGVARNERMERIVTNLKGLGFTISADDCLEASGGESVGRPHIVKALGMYPENREIINRIKAEMAAAAVNDPAVAMDYMRMLERSESDYPYRLFLSDDAFIPNIYVDYLYSIDLDQSVKLIRDAGGIAVLAHWPTISKKINDIFLEQLLNEKRLDGLELRSGYFDSQVDRAERDLIAMAARTGCITTYGIDGHRAVDIEQVSRDTSLANKSVGQTAKILEQVKPELGWSNL